MSTNARVLPAIDPVKPIDRLLLELERRDVLEAVNRICAEHGALVEEVFGQDRRAHVARARHSIWFWLHEDKRWSYPAIGGLSGHDHTTVLAGVAKVGRELGLVQFMSKGKKPRRAA